MSTCKSIVFGISIALVVGDIFASAKPLPRRPVPTMSMEDFEKQVSKSDEIVWLSSGYGNREFLFYTDCVTTSCFHRLSKADLSNNIKFPDGIKQRLKAGSLKIQQYHQDGMWVLGNKEFAVICTDDDENELVSFSNEATLNDLCRFTERLYNSVVSKQIVDSHEISSAYRALSELCIQVALERIKLTCVMFATGISFRKQWEPDIALNLLLCYKRQKERQYIDLTIGEKQTNDGPQHFFYYIGEWLPGRLFAECVSTPTPLERDELPGWSDATKRIIRGAYINQFVKAEDVKCAAYKYGEIFCACNRSYLAEVLGRIKENGAIDIRKTAYECSAVDLRFCETASDWWNDIHRNEYLTVAAQLMRINREILAAVRDKPYDEGFEELKLLADKWRPEMRKHMRNYHYLFSDLPVVLASQRAFAIALESDAFWSFNKDRKTAAGAAHQWARFCANGKVCHYLRSDFSSDIMTQYHGYLKKMLGGDAYKSLETTLKTSYAREEEEFPDKL